MNPLTYQQTFRVAFNDPNALPYAYQCRLAGGEGADEKGDFDHGTECCSRLIEIHTGLGKTAAVVLAWLWNRVLQPDEQARARWPRRLVYCLPMRTLVEQTRDEVRRWTLRFARRLTKPRDGSALRRLALHSPNILMGGEDAGAWDLYPEHEAILIGTQDMLLSRALNRGYGMSRYRWPMHFGLLNNDALWIFDEVQLMGAGLPTTAQLEAFRSKQSTGCRSWWMSATSDRGWLKTVDFDPATLGDALRLPKEDLIPDGKVDRLLNASKPLQRAATSGGDLKALAKEIVTESETSGGLTLIVVNTVKTARKLFAEVEKLARKAPAKPLLLHSRFRPEDRADILRKVLTSEGLRRLVISTQVIEAGVDLSAATLFTELAPWSSLVQRFGRCNRRGTEPGARIFWFEPTAAAPYSEEQLVEARQRLATQTSASPNALVSVPIPTADRPVAAHVIRRKDLVELFDTTPDLAGNDIDIDRWIREADESSVQVFWREWEGGAKGRRPGDEQKQPSRDELCPAGIGEFRDFVKKTRSPVWRWDFLEGEWQSVRETEIYPGQNYLLSNEAGGYTAATGWTPDSEAVVIPIPSVAAAADEKTEDDAFSQTALWQSIAQHTDQVCTELDVILSTCAIAQSAALQLAARWHDWGKAHQAFQAKLRLDAAAERERNLGGEPMAKAPKGMWDSRRLPAKPTADDLKRKRRKFFRHELASALGILHPEASILVEGFERDLVAYLVAAHHGKVRLSIRSLPGEWAAPDPIRFARGVWDGDVLPETTLGGAGGEVITAKALSLSLEPMELGLGEQSPFFGLPSWSDRMLTVRDKIGIFRLAYLETLLRAADERASSLAEKPAVVEIRKDEPSRTNLPVARTTSRGAATAEDAGYSAERLLEHVDGGRASEPRVAEGDTRPPGATRTIETTRGELSYTEVAELLASRVAELQAVIAAGGFAEASLDEFLLSYLHRELCGDLVPTWAGKWRLKNVIVGAHEPPAFHQLPTLLRDYSEDLRARWEYLTGDDEALLIESLAFAESRFLFIHPFEDFNGRIARLWLREILRRAGLPELRLEVRNAEEKKSYHAALHAADRHDTAPLQRIWRQRFHEVL